MAAATARTTARRTARPPAARCGPAPGTRASPAFGGRYNSCHVARCLRGRPGRRSACSARWPARLAARLLTARWRAAVVAAVWRLWRRQRGRGRQGTRRGAAQPQRRRGARDRHQAARRAAPRLAGGQRGRAGARHAGLAGLERGCVCSALPFQGSAAARARHAGRRRPNARGGRAAPCRGTAPPKCSTLSSMRPPCCICQGREGEGSYP